MVRVNIAQTPDVKIPVIVPEMDGTETIYADARITGEHILLTPAEGYAPESFVAMAKLGMVVGMTIDTPEHMCQKHPFLDGNGLDDPKIKVFDVASMHPEVDEVSQKLWDAAVSAYPSGYTDENDDRCDQSEEAETGMAEEPLDAKIYRLEGQDAKIKVIQMILSHRNPGTLEDKLRQIQVVVE